MLQRLVVVLVWWILIFDTDVDMVVYVDIVEAVDGR